VPTPTELIQIALEDGYGYGKWRDGAPDLELLADVAVFAMVVETGRQVFGGWCVSWGRSPERNEELAPQGSHPLSLHQWGLGADLIFRTKDACQRCFAFFTASGFGAYIRGDGLSLHVQRWPHGKGPRPEPSHQTTDEESEWLSGRGRA
jgi:hypothetical protein